jgi:hypothetical protein
MAAESTPHIHARPTDALYPGILGLSCPGIASRRPIAKWVPSTNYYADMAVSPANAGAPASLVKSFSKEMDCMAGIRTISPEAETGSQEKTIGRPAVRRKMFAPT